MHDILSIFHSGKGEGKLCPKSSIMKEKKAEFRLITQKKKKKKKFNFFFLNINKIFVEKKSPF